VAGQAIARSLEISWRWTTLSTGRDGDLPLLIFACGSAPIEMIRILLNLRPKSEVNLYRGSLEDWHTPLHAAVVENRLDVVQLLLDSGADPALISPAEWTPLFYAAIRSPEMVSVLLQDTNPEGKGIIFLDKQDRAGATAFATAILRVR